MNDQQQPGPEQTLAESRLLFSNEEVGQALDRLAEALRTRVGNRNPLFLTIMNGGMLPGSWLLSRLDFPLRTDLVHATRYRSGTSGGELQFRAKPHLPLAGEVVVLFDDIFDEGYTMASLRDWCLAEGADEVLTVALVLKRHERGLPRESLDLAGLDCPDVYIFGCGMDIFEYWRQLKEIRAWEPS